MSIFIIKTLLIKRRTYALNDTATNLFCYQFGIDDTATIVNCPDLVKFYQTGVDIDI